MREWRSAVLNDGAARALHEYAARYGHAIRVAAQFTDGIPRRRVRLPYSPPLRHAARYRPLTRVVDRFHPSQSVRGTAAGAAARIAALPAHGDVAPGARVPWCLWAPRARRRAAGGSAQSLAHVARGVAGALRR